MMKKELLELYGLILGDGTCYLDRKKYPRMIFFNFNKNLMNKVKRMCEKISKKRIKISSRQRKSGIEYSMSIPTIIVKKLLELGFSKKKLPKSVIKDRNSIFLLKGLFEAEGSYRGTRIYIYQKNAENILRGCLEIANKFSLSAHIHTSKNRTEEKCLVIENTSKIKKLFGNTVKIIKAKNIKKGNYHITKRAILKKLSNMKWINTSKIYNYLKNKDIYLSEKSNLIKKHLDPLWVEGILLKIPSQTKRNENGQFTKTECKWKLNVKLSKTQIMNFPYGVVR